MDIGSNRFLTRVSTSTRPPTILRLRTYFAQTASPLSERTMAIKATLRRQATPTIAVASDVELEAVRLMLARRLRFEFNMADNHDFTKPNTVFPPPDLQIIRSKLSQKLKKEFE